MQGVSAATLRVSPVADLGGKLDPHFLIQKYQRAVRPRGPALKTGATKQSAHVAERSAPAPDAYGTTKDTEFLYSVQAQNVGAVASPQWHFNTTVGAAPQEHLDPCRTARTTRIGCLGCLW